MQSPLLLSVPMAIQKTHANTNISANAHRMLMQMERRMIFMERRMIFDALLNANTCENECKYEYENEDGHEYDEYDED